MCVPALVDLCRRAEVEMIAGSYALPVWEWAAEHVEGADYKITRVLDDPDEQNHPFQPKLGWPSINRALDQVRLEIPDALGYAEIGNAYTYGKQYPRLKLTHLEVKQGAAVVVHPHSSHPWKSCSLVIGAVDFSRPVKLVGFPGEYSRIGWETVEGFSNMVKAVLECAGFVGLLSSFTNLAALFQKPQVIVSYTDEVPIPNPNARVLIRPSAGELQKACLEMGL